MEKPAKNVIYLPMAQNFPNSMTATVHGFTGNLIKVRSPLGPFRLTPVLRAALADVDPFIGLDQIGTLEHFQYESMAPPRVTATLLGVFAALAFADQRQRRNRRRDDMLSVTERNRELGIRMALGAERSAIVAMVVRQGITLALIGTAPRRLRSHRPYPRPVHSALRNQPDRRLHVSRCLASLPRRRSSSLFCPRSPGNRDRSRDRATPGIA